jgi:hypothetical protein
MERTHHSLISEAINKKFKSEKSEITVYYFNTNRRIIFPKSDLTKKFVLDGRWEGAKRDPPLLKHLIPYLVKQYCELFFNFEPLEVQHENFELKLANEDNEDDELLDPFSHDDEILELFECDNLVLIRKQKDYERFKVWKKTIEESETLRSDMEVIEVIIPFSQNEIMEQFDKNRDMNFLKEKIPLCNQLGNIIIVTYGNLTICPPEKKISEVVMLDRILEVYRLEGNSYEDVEANDEPCFELRQQPLPCPTDNRALTDAEFEVTQNFFSGKLYLHILGTKIIEKYEGGLYSFFCEGQRRVERSVYTLVAISCKGTTITMKFLSKTGPHLCVYHFRSKEKVEGFFKCILKVGRELKQNF